MLRICNRLLQLLTTVPLFVQYAKLAISLKAPGGGGGKKKKTPAAPQGGSTAPPPAEEEEDYEGGLC